MESERARGRKNARGRMSESKRVRDQGRERERITHYYIEQQTL